MNIVKLLRTPILKNIWGGCFSLARQQELNTGMTLRRAAILTTLPILLETMFSLIS